MLKQNALTSDFAEYKWFIATIPVSFPFQDADESRPQVVAARGDSIIAVANPALHAPHPPTHPHAHTPHPARNHSN